MAPSLGYIQRLSGHLITSKHLSHFHHTRFTSQIVQYLSNVQPQYKIEDPKNSEVSPPVDNREVTSDVVTKINIGRQITINRLCSSNQPQVAEVLSSDGKSGVPEGRPSPDKLMQVYNTLADSLPQLFVKPLDYSLYDDKMVFEDNIRNVRTEGLLNYVKQVALLRTVGHFKFAYVKFDILKMTQHPEDGTVRIRWRIRGISTAKVMLKFWKFKFWKIKDSFDQVANWYDGYSTFYVNQDGKIFKHVADKMMPDSDSVTTTDTPTDLNSAKLALMISVIPKCSDIGLLM